MTVVDLILFVVIVFSHSLIRTYPHGETFALSVLLSQLHLLLTKDSWSLLKSVAMSVCISQESHAHAAFSMLHFSPSPSFCTCPQDSCLKARSKQNLLWQLLSHNTSSVFPHGVPFFCVCGQQNHLFQYHCVHLTLERFSQLTTPRSYTIV